MTRVLSLGLLFFGLLSGYLPPTEATYPYYGTKIGPLSQLHHGVSGEVYAVDSRTLFIRNFNYDGEAPSAYFYVGNTPKPSNDGAYRLRDERGSSAPLTKRYRNKDITLSLPEGKTLRDIKWFSVWCDDFAVNFGDVKIPNSLDFPRPQKIAPLNGVHGVSSDNIVIVDAQTLLVPNFSYDGEAPDAKFWVGRGPKPSPQGLRIPDENGKESPLRRYDRKTIVLTLPGDLTVFDIGHFGVWCEAFTVDFGHIRIPEGLNVPPSLKMLGISPQSKLNCEVLYDDLAFEVRWAVAGESVVVQLVAKLEDGEYMSFGISPNPDHTEMVGADVVVAWVDKETGKGYAYDYYLDAKAQCSGGKGSCPDTRIEENSNSIRLLNAAMVNGYSIVTYQRPLKATDRLDLPIRTNGSQAIDWAIGPLNQRSEVSFHSKYPTEDHFLDFGRQPTWNCPMPEGESRPVENENSEEYYDRKPQPQRRTTTIQPNANRRGETRPVRRPVPTPKPANKNGAWEIPPIQCYEPEDGVFYAQMGPTGGKHGYPAITGHVGWGISWYINGLLIPEIHVVRGKTYTFVVEGGNDPENTAKYHPFYITDDPIGGYEYKTEEEKAGVKIFAGVHRSRSGKITPTGVGRLCNWTPDIDGPPADEFQSFGAYQRTLTLKCDEGEPGIITWTPDRNTPDTVYYHCFTHRHLGWKIHVHDTCDTEPQGSEIDEVFAEPEDDFVAEASIRHETKVLPSENFLLQHQDDLMKNHNMDGSPPKISFELNKSSEITKLIADGIRAAEALEDSVTKKQPLSTTSVFVPNTTPENFKLETVIINNLTLPEIQIPQEHLVLPNPELSTFLRPPQNSPVFRPGKIPVRRPPVHLERRPNIRPNRPVVVPQPSVIINHYRKQIPPLIRPFIKEKPFPIQPIASVLLLGQSSELRSGGMQRQNEPLLKTNPKPASIPVPYIDSAPQDMKKSFAVVRNGSGHKTKKPYMRLPVMPEKVNYKPMLFKKPFEIKEDPASETLRPAVNTGFQPDSVVVEGGFRPIIRRQNGEDQESEENEERINRREDDNVSEIDEALEKDALFFNKEEETQPFEPMFIPSPPDNANSTIIRKSIHRQKPLRLTGDLMDMEVEDGDDKMAVAAERLDTYYLPPDTKIRKGVVVPDGAVVTYDGKAVLDMSLVNSGPSRLHTTEAPRGMSKTEQLVRSTPQFGPFRGEIPPPVPDYLPGDAPQSNLMASKNSPKIPDNINPISTKLSLLKPKSKRDSDSSSED